MEQTFHHQNFKKNGRSLLSLVRRVKITNTKQPIAVDYLKINALMNQLATDKKPFTDKKLDLLKLLTTYKNHYGKTRRSFFKKLKEFLEENFLGVLLRFQREIGKLDRVFKERGRNGVVDNDGSVYNDLSRFINDVVDFLSVFGCEIAPLERERMLGFPLIDIKRGQVMRNGIFSCDDQIDYHLSLTDFEEDSMEEEFLGQSEDSAFQLVFTREAFLD